MDPELEGLITKKVIDQENELFTSIPTMEEIYATIKAMNPNKALVHDGYLGLFYVEC